jgi:arsenite methyltransferase
MNLVPDKAKAFNETYQSVKSQVVTLVFRISYLTGELPEGLRKSAEMYAGCISGAIQKKEYLQIVE